ncbi:MAG: hypothetical protein ACKPDI_02915, partial [Actinomycetota bacterium]
MGDPSGGQPIRGLVSQGQAAAARLRAAKQQQAKASNDKENDAANEDADAAQQDLDTINGELVRRTGQSVTLDGVLETGWAREMIVQGHSELQVSDTVSARLLQGGIEATGDLSDEEVMERQARIREAERQQLRDDIIRKETGRDPDDLDPEQVRRALRNAALKEADGTGLMADRPVFGHDPLDDDDDEIGSDMDEMANRLRVADFVGKPVGALTPADLNAYAKHVNDLALESFAGKPIEEMSAVERMKAQGRLNEQIAEAHRNAGKKTEDAAPDNGEGDGAGNGATGDGAIDGVNGRVVGVDGDPDEGDTGEPAPGKAAPGVGGGPVGVEDSNPANPGVAADATPPPSGNSQPGQHQDSPSHGGSQPANTNDPVDVMFQSSHGRNTGEAAPDGGAQGAESVMLTFNRTADGHWYDEAGHEVTDPATIAALEADWVSYQEAGGTATA